MRLTESQVREIVSRLLNEFRPPAATVVDQHGNTLGIDRTEDGEISITGPAGNKTYKLLAPKVIPVFRGDKYDADIFVTAISQSDDVETGQPTVRVMGDATPIAGYTGLIPTQKGALNSVLDDDVKQQILDGYNSAENSFLVSGELGKLIFTIT